MQIPARSFTINYNSLVNAIKSEIELSLPFKPGKDKSQHPPIKKYVGIWDTGATGSVISNNIVKELNLAPIDVIKVYHAQGSSESFVYLVNVLLPNRVGISYVRVCEGDIKGADILIGMDIILRGDFVITNKDNNFIFF